MPTDYSNRTATANPLAYARRMRPPILCAWERQWICDLLAAYGLPSRSVSVFHLWLDGKSMAEVGQALGISRERARQIRNRAIHRFNTRANRECKLRVLS